MQKTQSDNRIDLLIQFQGII